MSLSPSSPLIDRWIREGWKWQFFWKPTYQRFLIPAGKTVQLPSQNFIFKAAEGALLTFSGLFDNPLCGIKMHNSKLDTKEVFTVNNVALGGGGNMPIFCFASLPPYTLPGTYAITNAKEWAWTEWCEIYVINTDSVDHYCLGFAYTMATAHPPKEEK